MSWRNSAPREPFQDLGGGASPKRLASGSPVPRIRIQIGVLGSGRTKLAVYNLKGQLIRVLLDEFKQEGTYNLDWDGTDGSGQAAASGVYQLVLRQSSKQYTTRLTLIK